MTQPEVGPVTRETWQAHHADINFGGPNPETPFLSCLTALDHPATAEAAVRDYAQILNSHNIDTDLRRSPNWSALLEEGSDLPVPLEDDPFAQETIQGRFRYVETRDQEIREEEYPQAIERIRAGIEEGVREGYLLENTPERFEQAVRLTAFVVADHTFLQMLVDPEGSHETTAWYDEGSDIVYLSADISPTEFAVTVAHELLGHKSAGGTFRAYSKDDPTPSRVRFGFSQAMESGEEEHVGIDEVFAHHKALACAYGDFAAFDPDSRDAYEEGNQDYYAYRKIIAECIKKSEGIVQLKTMMRASCEDTTEAGVEFDERKLMIAQVRAAYGAGVFNKLDTVCRRAAAASEFLGLNSADGLQHFLDRIHGPAVDAQGDVTPGFIDITGLE